MAKKHKRKIKPIVKRAFLYIMVFIIVGIYATNEGIKIHKEYLYRETDEYKLQQVGYSLDESKYFLSNLDDETINYLKDNDYNEIYYKLITCKYFLNKNFTKYIEYINMHEKENLDTVIALTNTHASSGWYNQDYDTDITKGDLILVNKFYHLSSDYIRDDLKNASLQYSYSNNKVSEKVLDAFEEMRQDVMNELNVKLMINSSYRSYEEQEEIYNEFKKVSLKYADSYAARPGYSEHQTGLAIDITSLEHPSSKSFSESDEYKWLIDNCYKYGFILRYPEGKDNITGYKTESWHFRYVGLEAAKKIHDENITFDEYYAYYVEGNN